MRKTGKIFIVVGTILAAVFVFVGANYFVNAFQYISAVVGMIMLFLGISFLFFGQALQKRKRTTLKIFIVALILFAVSLASSRLHLPGSNIEFILSISFFCFTCMPLVIKNRYEKWVNFTPYKWQALVLTLADFICVLCLVLGFLFKNMHWPGAKFLITLGAVMFFIAITSWNNTFKREVQKRKEAEDKVKEALDELKEKNTEIIDSINYAKRLQQAILPPDKLINQYLPEAFVLYKPKDIVAGDFYWIEKVNDTVFFAVADCTGHGVPGAMVSVVCSNALDRVVKEFRITEPGKILDKIRELVIETFEKSESEVKDGMDISLCAISKSEVNWSGANNPLWILSEGKLTEIKANKQPIGKHLSQTPFTNHRLEAKQGDILYLFTDGLADQFGGPNGKKFKYKQFSDLLVTLQHLPLAQQKEKIDQTFQNWKGNLNQVDDVCVAAIRV